MHLFVVKKKKSKAGCDHLANAIKQREKKIHILVNNSGATWGAPYDKYEGSTDVYRAITFYSVFLKWKAGTG